jgi:hypothetical protein
MEDAMKRTEGVAALGLLGLLWTAATLLPRPNEFETRMLPPEMKPKGEGWEPMNAVTHTSLYGGLEGKPVARVVWKRRRPTPVSALRSSREQALHRI